MMYNECIEILSIIILMVVLRRKKSECSSCTFSAFGTEIGTCPLVCPWLSCCSESTMSTNKRSYTGRAVMDIIEVIKTLNDEQCQFIISALTELLREESVQSEQACQGEASQSI